MHIKAQRAKMCLKCLSPIGAEVCSSSRCKGIMHTFDSTMEANRYIWLHQHSTDVKCQFKINFTLCKIEPALEGFNNKKPEEFKLGKPNPSISYKVDFYHYCPEKGATFEEFKPSMFCKKKQAYKPIVDEGARVKLKLLSDAVSHWANVCISYPDKTSLTGYGIKKL